MKANRKFLNGDDEAVSPVIAVILMVAITVVLAATVYVWVSGFGSSSTSATKSVSLNSAGPISNGYKNYTVASATPGLKWSELTITLEGSSTTYDAAILTSPNANDICVMESGNVCTAGSALPANTVDAGDTLTLYHASLSGKTLRVVDSGSNSVIATIPIG